jgi:hypothetical protein
MQARDEMTHRSISGIKIFTDINKPSHLSSSIQKQQLKAENMEAEIRGD